MSDAEFLSGMADLQRMQMRQMMEISSAGGGMGMPGMGMGGGGGVGDAPYRAPSVAAMLRMLAGGGNPAGGFMGGMGGVRDEWSLQAELSLLRRAAAANAAAAGAGMGGHPSGPRTNAAGGGAPGRAADLSSKAPKVKAPRHDVGDKPKRPFSAYNLFFQMEREFIMDLLFEGKSPEDEPLIKAALAANPGKGGDDKAGDDKAEDDRTRPAAKMKRPPPKDPANVYVDPDMPKRYAHLQLDRHWYSVIHKAKRKHRKTEGSVGFTRLTWMVSSRWKRIGTDDPETKAYCQRLADRELEKYKKATEEYREKVRAAEDEARKAEPAAAAGPPAVPQGVSSVQRPTGGAAAGLGALLGMAPVRNDPRGGAGGPDAQQQQPGLGALTGMAPGRNGPRGGAGEPGDAPPRPPAQKSQERPEPPPPARSAPHRRGSLLRPQDGPGTPTESTFRSSFRDSFARGSFRLGSDFGRFTDLSFANEFRSPFGTGPDGTGTGGLPGFVAGSLPPPPFSGGSGDGGGGGDAADRPSEEALAMARAEMEAEARANFARSNSSQKNFARSGSTHSQRSQDDMMTALAHAEARASASGGVGGMMPGGGGFGGGGGGGGAARGDAQPSKEELDEEVTRFLNRFRHKGSQGSSHGSGEGRSG